MFTRCSVVTGMRSVWYSCCFDIFQVQLQRSPPIVFICLQAIHHIDARRQGGFHVSHTEANTIEHCTTIILKRQFQMLPIHADRACGFDLHIPRDEDRIRIAITGWLQIIEVFQHLEVQPRCSVAPADRIVFQAAGLWRRVRERFHPR